MTQSDLHPHDEDLYHPTKRQLELIDMTLVGFLMIKGINLLTGKVHGEAKDVLHYLKNMEERFTIGRH